MKPAMRRSLFITLLLTLSTAAVSAETTVSSSMSAYRQKAERFARDRLGDAHDLLVGPERPAAMSPTDLDCRALYARRVALIQDRLDYRPTFWDDPRNRTSVFLGATWTPAFYYLGYSALAGYTQANTGPQRQAEIDALRSASARQRCFER
jgi:hypothetical protein